MLTDDFLDQLRYKGEGSDLDYKSERYPFADATDDAKSELLKDILALANAHRDGTAFILIGFKENSPHPAEVVGLSSDGAIDDSRVQQFVNEKLETKLDFRYEERLFDGKQIAVISIPKQSRPFYLKKPFGRLAKETVYIRRGSSTAIASLREVAMMGAVNISRPAARVELELRGQDGRSLSNELSLTFYEGGMGELPDYSTPRSYGRIGDVSNYIETHRDNSDFWREAARYVTAMGRLFGVRLRLTNNSDFALTGTKLEVQAVGPARSNVGLDLLDDLPELPAPRWSVYLPQMPKLSLGKTQSEVDDRESMPLCRIRLGTLLPGESVIAEDDIAVLPDCEGEHLLKIRLLAEEINTPLIFEHKFHVRGDSVTLDLERLRKVLADLQARGVE